MSCMSGGSDGPVYPTDPNPAKFKIRGYKKIGDWLVVRINYLNCANYQGDKILVFKSMTEKELEIKRIIDPHFMESDGKLVARFRPTPSGWDYAVEFARNN